MITFLGVNYINTHSKVRIICSKHGEFLQTLPNIKVGRDVPDVGMLN